MSTEQAFFPAPFALGGSRIVAVPSQFYSTGEDYLQVASVCSVPGVTVQIRARIVGPDGPVNVESWTHTPNSNRTTKTDVFNLGVGALLNLSVFATGAPLAMNQCYVVVSLVRGALASGLAVATLLAGSITGTQALGWPGSPIQSSLAGPGTIRNITGSTPMSGVEINEVVPAGARWELLSFVGLLQTDASVATRTPSLYSLNGGAYGFFASQTTGAVATQTLRYVWQSGYGLNQPIIGSTIVTSLPVSYPLLAGSSINTLTVNLHPGDAWGFVQYTVREWLEVP